MIPQSSARWQASCHVDPFGGEVDHIGHKAVVLLAPHNLVWSGGLSLGPEIQSKKPALEACKRCILYMVMGPNIGTFLLTPKRLVNAPSNYIKI